MTEHGQHWKPSADIATLKKRAQVLKALRAFFDARDVVEVQTPLMSSSAATDVHLDSFSVLDDRLDERADERQAEGSKRANQKHYLLTSPELPIKRLLCAGMGDCYQISPVFRCGEQGSRHNPEFTMLEWYRLGFTAFDLMDEVIELIQTLVSHFSGFGCSLTVIKKSYQAVFLEGLGFDPITICAENLNKILSEKNLWDGPPLSKNEALDLLFSQCIEINFPHNQLTAIYHYPATQAALARVCVNNSDVSERFEVFWGGMELVNGFYELADAQEQRQRFEQDKNARKQLDKHLPPHDDYFLKALESGLPDCSGVALGVDRLVMKVLGKTRIQDVLAFGFDRV